MTGKQLTAAKEGWFRTQGSATTRSELYCIEMMHSILVYEFHPNSDAFPFPENDYYLQDYIKDLGVERVRTLWNEQVEDYRHAEVGHAGCDPDGCAYNYCIWADEK